MNKEEKEFLKAGLTGVKNMLENGGDISDILNEIEDLIEYIK